jgi:biopolymer transport protein ExbD
MLDLTGSSDIIFTLLLFYILTQNFLPALEVNLPEITGPTAIKKNTSQIITLKASGEISFAAQTATLDEITRSPHRFFSGLSSQQPVIIRVDQQAIARDVIGILDIMCNLQIKDLVFQGIPNAASP